MSAQHVSVDWTELNAKLILVLASLTSALRLSKRSQRINSHTLCINSIIFYIHSTELVSLISFVQHYLAIDQLDSQFISCLGPQVFLTGMMKL